MSLGLRLVSAIIRDDDRACIAQLNPSLFLPTELPAYEFFRRYYSEQGLIPTLSIMADNGFALEVIPRNETTSYILGRIHARAKYNAFNSEFENIQGMMRSRDMDGIARTMQHILASFASATSSTEFLSLGGLATESIAAARARRLVSGTLSGVTYGYPFIDDRTGGLQGGELFVLAGRPNQGKSYILLNMAHKAWVSGKSVLFISMEMHEKAIARRLLGIEAGLNPDSLKTGLVSNFAMEDFEQAVQMFSSDTRPPFSLVSGNFKKSVSDIDAAIQLHAPDIVYVDAGYLLKPSSKYGKKDRRELISEVIEELKTVALSRNKPIAISVQFNRQVKRKQKGDLDLANIAETDVIGQVADVVAGIQEPDEGEDTKSKRKITIVKNREGPVFDSFMVNFSFAPLDFSELNDENQEEAAEGWAA